MACAPSLRLAVRSGCSPSPESQVQRGTTGLVPAGAPPSAPDSETMVATNGLTEGAVEFSKQDLIRQLEASAEWRAKKAAEHADEPRHAQSAEVLARAVEDVKVLSDEDSRMSQIRRLYNSEDEEAIAAYDGRAILMIADHGFVDPDATTDELLDKLAEVAANASATSFGVQMPPKRLR